MSVLVLLLRLLKKKVFCFFSHSNRITLSPPENNGIQNWLVKLVKTDEHKLCLCVFKVSSLFKDGTIGGNINIVIVGLVLLDEEQVTTSKYLDTLRLPAII